MAELKEVIPAANKIVTDAEEISYDALVLATGADTNFFGNTTIADNAFPMKSTVEALQLRYRLLQNLEQALTINDPIELQRLMNIVVVGGGPTGVEMSGAIADLKRFVLPKDYPELDFDIFHVDGGHIGHGGRSQDAADLLPAEHTLSVPTETARRIGMDSR